MRKAGMTAHAWAVERRTTRAIASTIRALSCSAMGPGWRAWFGASCQIARGRERPWRSPTALVGDLAEGRQSYCEGERKRSRARLTEPRAEPLHRRSEVREAGRDHR